MKTIFGLRKKMNRRKKNGLSPKGNSAPVTKRKRYDSCSPIRKEKYVVRPPPEFPIFNYKEKCPTFCELISEDSPDLTELQLTSLQYELEMMLAESAMNTRRAKGEVLYLNSGDYPKEDLKRRLMPTYELLIPPTPATEESILDIKGICGLPEEEEEEDFNQFPPEHVPSRFWIWCKKNFLENIDADYLKQFKEQIVDKYSYESLQKYFVNEPWKYRKRTVQIRPSRNCSGLSLKTPKKVSISNDVECSGSGKSQGRKSSSARIANRRSSEKDSSNNNKIMPMIGSMVISACREYKDSKSAPETPVTSRRNRKRLSNRDELKETKGSVVVKNEPIEIDVDDIPTTVNGFENGNNGKSPKLHSPRLIKKEREEEDKITNTNGFYSLNDKMNGYLNGFAPGSNGNTNGKINGVNSQKCPKKKNGELKNGMVSNNEMGSRKKSIDKLLNDSDITLDLEDFDAKAIGSKIVSKLIAGGILPESSAHIFEQMSKEDCDLAGTSKFEINQEGKDEADDPEIDELSEELQKCQLELQEMQPQLNAVITLAWRRAKAQYAFLYSFDQLRAADYDLFKLGVNMYKDLPRKLPSIMEKPVLKEAMQRRNRLARFHYGNTYRRQPKYRWRLKPQMGTSKSSPAL